MKLYRAIVNDYGHGECTHLLVVAPSIDDAINEIRNNGDDYNFDEDYLFKIDGLTSDSKVIEIIETF